MKDLMIISILFVSLHISIQILSIWNLDQFIIKFNQLHDTTAERHNFHRFSNKYITEEFTTFAKNKEAVVFNAYLSDGQLDSSAIIIYYGQMAVYRHGASLNLNNKIPTSYLIQWEAIKEAKKRGCVTYDFWGQIDPFKYPKHPYANLLCERL